MPIYLNGARMTYFSAIMPINDGLGLVFAVTSYDGKIIISPTSCREQMPDPEAFAQCVRDCFQEYLGARPRRGGRQGEARQRGQVREPGGPRRKSPGPRRRERPPAPLGLRQPVGDDPQHQRVEPQPEVAAGHADVLVQRAVAVDRRLLRRHDAVGHRVQAGDRHRQLLPPAQVLGARLRQVRPVPIGWAISRYSALTSGGDWLPPASRLTGLPSVITERTHSVASCAPYIANMPPRLQPTRLTLRPLLWCM